MAVQPALEPKGRIRPSVLRRHQAPRFLVVGGLTALTDFGVLALLHGGLGAPLAVSTAVAFAAAFLVNFTLSRQWTFPTGHYGSRAAQLSRFSALVIANLIVTVLIVTGLAALGLNYLLAKMIAVAVTAPANFYLYRRWVFV